MNDKHHHNSGVSENGAAIQMPETFMQMFLELQPTEQRLIQNQSGKGSQPLIFEFQVRNFIGVAMDLRFTIFHLRCPPEVKVFDLFCQHIK
jgi:hypothetical protein